MRWLRNVLAAAFLSSLLQLCQCVEPGLGSSGGRLQRTPEPTPWPPRFHAVLFLNNSNILELTDLYYDWPGGRNLLIIRKQQGAVKHDVEYNNHTSFIFERAANTCSVLTFSVGILRPDWLDGAAFLGRQNVDNRTVNVFTKSDFIDYYEDIQTGRPVRWFFHPSQRQFDVMEFDVGGMAPEEEWFAPEACFS